MCTALCRQELQEYSRTWKRNSTSSSKTAFSSASNRRKRGISLNKYISFHSTAFTLLRLSRIHFKALLHSNSCLHTIAFVLLRAQSGIHTAALMLQHSQCCIHAAPFIHSHSHSHSHSVTSLPAPTRFHTHKAAFLITQSHSRSSLTCISSQANYGESLGGWRW